MAQGTLVSHRTVSAEAHQSTIETVRQVTDFGGRTVLVTNRYVELATGLNRWDERQQGWVPAVAGFEPSEDGCFVARRTQTQLVLPPDLSTEPVDMLGPDGVRLISAPIGVAVVDLSTGDTALLGSLQSCRAEQVAPDTVVFRNCLAGLRADLVYQIRLSGIEQLLVLREWIPALQDLGMDPAHVRVQLYTEFFDPPEPTGKAIVLKRADEATLAQRVWEPDLTDRQLEFGESTRMIPGRAFAAGDQNVDAPVAKSFESVGERRLLVESCDYEDVATWLEQLPVPEEAVDYEGVRLEPDKLVPANLPERQATKPRWASRPFENRLREKAWASVSPDSFKAMDTGAYLAASGPGMVLDYTTLSGTLTDYTFAGDTTYYVSGTTFLNGTTSLEGGAVIKYPPGVGAVLVQGPFLCKTVPYRPAIFTARDDDTVGAVIAGSTGSVGTGTYGSHHLYFYNTGGPVDVRHVRVKHAYNGLIFKGDFTHLLRHAQLIDCRQPLVTVGSTTLKAQNVLIANVKPTGAAFWFGSGPTIEGQHLTVVNSPNLHQFGTPASFTLWNSLLVDVGQIQDYVNRGLAHNIETTGAGSVFQSKGGGGYYLAASSPYRDLGEGSPDIEADLLSDLKAMTTEPPEKPVGAITGNTTWYRRSIRDINEPDLGYHYPALDYLVSGTAIQNVTLTLRNGVAVAGGDAGASTGFVLDPGGDLAGSSASLEPNRLVHAAAVQETSPGSVTLIAQNGGSGAARTVDLRSTQLVIPASSGSHFSGGAATSQLSLRDCELYNGQISFEQAGAISRTVTLNNNVFVRLLYMALGTGTDTGLTANAYNNTFYQCPTMVLNAASGTSWQWHDNLFENSGFWLFYADVVNSHNAYVFAGTGDPLPNSSGNDIMLNGCSGLTYLTDAWGRGWYADTALLTAAGSRSVTAAGLSDYTTGTHQNLEGDGTVSIGFHRRSEAPRRLAYWRFDDVPDWLVSDEGVAPSSQSGLGDAQVASFTGGGMALEIKDSGDTLIYPETQPAGYPSNLDLKRGSIRLWFKPNWTLSTGYPNGAPLLDVTDASGDLWRIYFEKWSTYHRIRLDTHRDGQAYYWLAMPMDDHLSQAPPGDPPYPNFFAKWKGAESDWLQLTVTWDAPGPWTGTTVFADGKRVFYAYSTYKYWGGGPGGVGIDPTALPPPEVLGEQGFALGGDGAGNNPAKGKIDEVELFSYPIGSAEHGWQKYAWAAEVQSTPTPHITLRQPDAPNPGDTEYYYWRRAFGQSTWTKIQEDPTSARTIEDGNVTANVLYEYARSTGVPPGQDLQEVQTVGIELEPVHQRGHVILLVDPTFLPGSPNDLSPEIAQLEEDLVGDGWTVAGPLEARRHEEQTISPNIQYSLGNEANLGFVHQLIAGNRDQTPGVENVVLILGRVTIPYSGGGTFDSHLDHAGPWVADTYYGVLDEEQWTDTQTTTGYQWRVAGDGYFDNDNAPPLDMAVGRVDFAKLNVFANADFLPPGLSNEALETELLRLYLSKNHRYRMGELPVGKRMSYQDGIVDDYLLPDAVRLASSLFGLDNNPCFNAKPYLLPKAPCLWAWYFNFGQPSWHALGGQMWFKSEERLVLLAEEPPNLFYHLKGSYFPDWNLWSTYAPPPGNLMRSLLATPNYGLACVSWVGWTFDRLGCGGHLGTAMLGRTGGQNRAFMSIIGDPTLRMNPMLPVKDLSATRDGSEVTLTWTPSEHPAQSWFVYRSTAGLGGFASPLAETTVPEYEDNSAPAGVMYQVRACRLEVNGAGSYRNLSQGKFTNPL